MSFFTSLKRRLFGTKGTPLYDGAGGGRRSLAWMPLNLGAVSALAYAQSDLRAKSRDLVRRNAWAAAGVEAFVANAISPRSYLIPYWPDYYLVSARKPHFFDSELPNF